MGKAVFKEVAAQVKPWWFTRDEVHHLEAMRVFQSRNNHVWFMKDASPSTEIDAISFTDGDTYVCISKHMDRETSRPVYDVTSAGEKTRTVKSFSAAQAMTARALQIHTRVDHLWTNIESRRGDEMPALK